MRDDIESIKPILVSTATVFSHTQSDIAMFFYYVPGKPTHEGATPEEGATYNNALKQLILCANELNDLLGNNRQNMATPLKITSNMYCIQIEKTVWLANILFNNNGDLKNKIAAALLSNSLTLHGDIINALTVPRLTAHQSGATEKNALFKNTKAYIELYKKYINHVGYHFTPPSVLRMFQGEAGTFQKILKNELVFFQSLMGENHKSEFLSTYCMKPYQKTPLNIIFFDFSMAGAIKTIISRAVRIASKGRITNTDFLSFWSSNGYPTDADIRAIQDRSDAALVEQTIKTYLTNLPDKIGFYLYRDGDTTALLQDTVPFICPTIPRGPDLLGFQQEIRVALFIINLLALELPNTEITASDFWKSPTDRSVFFSTGTKKITFSWKNNDDLASVKKLKELYEILGSHLPKNNNFMLLVGSAINAGGLLTNFIPESKASSDQILPAKIGDKPTRISSVTTTKNSPLSIEEIFGIIFDCTVSNLLKINITNPRYDISLDEKYKINSVFLKRITDIANQVVQIATKSFPEQLSNNALKIKADDIKIFDNEIEISGQFAKFLEALFSLNFVKTNNEGNSPQIPPAGFFQTNPLENFTSKILRGQAGLKPNSPNADQFLKFIGSQRGTSVLSLNNN